MAIMIPSKPRFYTPESKENLIFESLEKLSDAYYVVHSFDNVCTIEKSFREHECDFVVFHPNKGIIFIEVKATHIKYENGTWFYANGTEMKYGGPYEQANMNKRHLLQQVTENIRRNCKFLHAVWFPLMSLSEIKTLPPEADKSIKK